MNITISMPKQYVDRLKQAAASSGMTQSDILRRALDAYLKQEKL